MSLGTAFGDAAATNSEKNVRIGRILRQEDVEDVSRRLRSLTTSVQLTPDYQSYILHASVQGVKDYLQRHREQMRNAGMTYSRIDTQALHNSIMAHASSVNLQTIIAGGDKSNTVPETATVIHERSRGLLGYHQTRYLPLTRTWEFSIGVDESHGLEETVDTVAHETAHHIERKIGLLRKWDEKAVPELFRTDAAYFDSLDAEGAYISGCLDHALYEGQANERMARDAGKAAKIAFRNFLFGHR